MPSPRDGGGAPKDASTTYTDTSHHHNDRATSNSIGSGRQQQQFDVANGLRVRRECASRLPGGDPDRPNDRRYHRPATGLRASGFCEGFAAGIRWASHASAEEIAAALGRAKAGGVS